MTVTPQQINNPIITAPNTYDLITEGKKNEEEGPTGVDYADNEPEMKNNFSFSTKRPSFNALSFEEPSNFNEDMSFFNQKPIQKERKNFEF